MRTVHVVLPGDIDDPLHPSGGNAYDREVCTGLAALGWSVREHPVAGSWPHPEPESRAGLATTFAGLPDGAVVLLDGLVALAAPTQTAVASERLRVVVLAHMVGPDEDAPAERVALLSAAGVVTTSAWTRDQLVERHALPAERVHVAEPGAHHAEATVGSEAGGRLLCVGPISRAKGHDVLLEALADVADLPWTCTCVGPLDRDPVLVGTLRDRVEQLGLTDRVTLTGALPDLSEQYADTDLLVHPTRAEAYGMVVTEALAHAVPVLASDVGGVPLALGHAESHRPGMLVPPGDPHALAEALRLWLDDADTRARLRSAAGARRRELTPWRETVTRVAQVLSEVADGP